jgi:hypothetical protein
MAYMALRESMALVAREGDTRDTQKALEGKHEKRDHLENLRVCRELTLICICKK